jgi:hypothetical protein
LATSFVSAQFRHVTHRHKTGKSEQRKSRLKAALNFNPDYEIRRPSTQALTSDDKPGVGLLAQLFLLILRYVDLTIRIAALDALSHRALAPGVYARIDVTNSGRRSCLRHESAAQSHKEYQGEKRKYETRHRFLQQNEE